MRPLALLALPLILTACASPQQQCLSAATREARINAQLIAQTEANLARGYAVQRTQRVREVNRICRGVTASGEPVATRCEDVRVTPVTVPVAIDLNAEAAKLESLKQRRAALAAGTDTAVAQCRRLYPE